MSGATSRRLGALLALALALSTPLAVATVQAHGDHVRADSQVTDDGTVLVETVSSIRPGFVVLRADAGGRPGDPIGSVYVGRTPDHTYRTDVAVSIDPSVWDEWGTERTVWAVLHADADGDEEFDFGTDRAVELTPAAETRITVRKSESGQARVLAAAFDPQRLDDGTVTVRRVDLPAAGHLVVRPTGSNRTLGSLSLAAGTHRNVTVALNESFVAEQTREFRVRVVVHRDDGDGVFGPSDPPITAGDRTVGTYLTVAPGNASTDRPLVNTPVATTASSSPAATETTVSVTEPPGAVTTAPDSPSDSATTATADGSGSGFGVVVALLAVLVATLAVAARSRR